MTGDHRVVLHPEASAFLRRAGAWLLRAEAEHNLLMGLAARLATGMPAEYRPPLLLATVETGGRVAGCAFRTPPHPLGLTRMPRAALPTLVERVGEVYDTLPGALGPDETAATFGELWSRGRDQVCTLKMRQTVYSLETLLVPESLPPGAVRVAREEDRALAAEWFQAFQVETGVPALDAEARVDALTLAGDLWLWEDREPRAVAAVVARTPHGARLGFVYTPRSERGRGYGTAVSAAVTRRILEEGARFAFLYADQANPASNAIYRRLGYRPVCDVSDYRFRPS